MAPQCLTHQTEVPLGLRNLARQTHILYLLLPTPTPAQNPPSRQVSSLRQANARMVVTGTLAQAPIPWQALRLSVSRVHWYPATTSTWPYLRLHRQGVVSEMFGGARHKPGLPHDKALLVASRPPLHWRGRAPWGA